MPANRMVQLHHIANQFLVLSQYCICHRFYYGLLHAIAAIQNSSKCQFYPSRFITSFEGITVLTPSATMFQWADQHDLQDRILDFAIGFQPLTQNYRTIRTGFRKMATPIIYNVENRASVQQFGKTCLQIFVMWLAQPSETGKGTNQNNYTREEHKMITGQSLDKPWTSPERT